MFVYFFCVGCQVFLNNPEEVLNAVGESVVVVDRLQEETSVWDFLLGLPDLFLKPTDKEKLKTGAVELGNLKKFVFRNSHKSDFFKGRDARVFCLF